MASVQRVHPSGQDLQSSCNVGNPWTAGSVSLILKRGLGGSNPLVYEALVLLLSSLEQQIQSAVGTPLVFA